MGGFFRELVKRFLGWFAPFLREQIKDVLLTYFLDAAREKDLQAHNVGLVALYPILDVYAEEAVKVTGNKFDDALILGIMDAMEESAELAGLELPNLDED